MAEENQAAVTGISPEEAANAQFQIQKLYVKDISFELPNAPEIFQEQGQADVKMSLAQRVEDLGENLMEVVLTITVTASMGEKTAYLAEIAQAGIFLVIQGHPVIHGTDPVAMPQRTLALDDGADHGQQYLRGRVLRRTVGVRWMVRAGLR